MKNVQETAVVSSAFRCEFWCRWIRLSQAFDGQIHAQLVDARGSAVFWGMFVAFTEVLRPSQKTDAILFVSCLQ